ncbi:MAG: hypothetical protein ABFS39_14310 [Pseudomonadota bacterium]
MTDQQNKSEVGEDPAISHLYRATRIEEPDAALDVKILAEAKAVTHHQRRRWLLPLSSAAVVLLGVTLTLKLMDQAPRLPQSIDDFNYEQPAESRAIQRAEKKQAQPAPAMMMESMSAPAKEHKDKLKLQKAAPRTSAPAGGSLQGLGQMDASEAFESNQQDLPAVEIMDDPAEWLAHIQMVLDRGERNRAVQELKAFIATYPEYPLPESLQRPDLD